MKNIKHHTTSWSALDITSYMEYMEDYNELQVNNLNEDFLLGILKDILDENNDYIIEKINNCILNYLSQNRNKIIKDIQIINNNK